MAWGIMMTMFTLFGMLALVLGVAVTNEGTPPWEPSQDPDEPVATAFPFKKAA